MATVLPSFDNHPLLADAELDCLLDDDIATRQAAAQCARTMAEKTARSAPKAARLLIRPEDWHNQ